MPSEREETAMAGPAGVAWDEYHALENELHRHKPALADALHQLESIQASNGWKIVYSAYRVAGRLLPERSRRMRVARKAVRTAVRCLKLLRRGPRRPLPVAP